MLGAPVEPSEKKREGENVLELTARAELSKIVQGTVFGIQRGKTLIQ